METSAGSRKAVEHSGKSISLQVNGKSLKVQNVDANIRLVDFLRDSVGVKGTKVMCREGGCGACTVIVSKEEPRSNPKAMMTVNSCLVPLVSLDGCYVITIEGLGSDTNGLSKIQEDMITNFGMQCGFCTSGVIMNGLGALIKDPAGMTKDPREFFDGNICRCTGYRPIMDAMKCSAKAFSLEDIEDICKPRTCKGANGLKVINLPVENDNRSSCPYYRPQNMNEIYEIFDLHVSKEMDIVCGNSGSGIFKDISKADVTLIINQVDELRTIECSDRFLCFGAAVTLAEMILTMEKLPTMSPIAEHLKKIGNNSVRNIASWAGNLMMLHRHRRFQSDIYLLLEIANCQLTIVDFSKKSVTCSLPEFLSMDMDKKMILSLRMDVFSKTDKVKTFKIMPRHQNSHAYVNAAFRAKTDPETLKLIDQPLLVYGGLGSEPIHAAKTEQYLDEVRIKGLRLDDNKVLQSCCKILQEELSPINTLLGPSPEYKKQVAINLFYKFYLSLLNGKISHGNISAVTDIAYPDYHSEQSFPSREKKYPLTQPIKRLDSDLLVCGRTEYTSDVPAFKDEVFISFVVAGMAPAKLLGIDTDEAKKMPGYIDVLSKDDITGSNSICQSLFKYANDHILCDGNIDYAGQPVAIAVAASQRQADDIANVVKVHLESQGKPVIHLKDSVEKRMFFANNLPAIIVGNTADALKSCDHVISGQLEIASMHYLYIEPQTCAVVIREKDVEVFSSTQHASAVQMGVAEALGIKAHKVYVTNQKCGGAFGGKTRSSVTVAAAAAIAARAVKRPVRMSLDYTKDMELSGTRAPFLANYTVGFSSDGLLKAIEMDIYVDVGCEDHNVDVTCVQIHIDGGYFCPNWIVNTEKCKTHTTPNLHMRGPGFLQSKFIIESIMEHVATTLNESVDIIREKNLYKTGKVLGHFGKMPLESGKLENLWNDVLAKSDYHSRKQEVERFNKENRWKKRGISFLPLLYRNRYNNFHYTASVSILYADGTVVVHHGGSEMGQGINTRMSQLAARWLNVPVDMISIGSTSTRTAPNCDHTAASVASEQVGMAVIKCCEILNERLLPLKEEYPHYSWSQLIALCWKRRIELSSTYMFNDQDKTSYAYSSYGAVCSEAEVDIFTGEVALVRTDLTFDCGESINPSIDIGQVEGSFVMGLGQYMQEKIIYDPQTAKEVTSSTWEYHPPMAKDIPADFRVHLANSSANKVNLFGSKAVGEPSLGMALSCLLAARGAVSEARKDAGDNEYFRMDAPATIDELQQQTAWNIERLTI